MDSAPDLFEPLSNLTPTLVRWLWPGRFALGKLSILDGDPGLGKSLVTLDLCARLTTGRELPDGVSPLWHDAPRRDSRRGASCHNGAPAPLPCNAVVCNAEDAAADTVAPRLTALGGNLARVFIVRHDPDELLAAADGKPRRATPADLAAEFLMTLLDDGPRSTRDVWQAAQGKGIARRILQRVRSRLEIASQTVWEHDRAVTYWRLPGQELPAHLLSDVANQPGYEDWLELVREPDPLTDE